MISSDNRQWLIDDCGRLCMLPCQARQVCFKQLLACTRLIRQQSLHTYHRPSQFPFTQHSTPPSNQHHHTSTLLHSTTPPLLSQILRTTPYHYHHHYPLLCTQLKTGYKINYRKHPVTKKMKDGKRSLLKQTDAASAPLSGRHSRN